MLLTTIKELCRKRGISVSSLENELGFGANTIYRWKNQNPSIDKISKVADYFNVSTDYLLGRTNEEYFIKSEEESEPEIRILQRAAKEMTPEERKKALQLWQLAFDKLFDEKK